MKNEKTHTYKLNQIRDKKIKEAEEFYKILNKYPLLNIPSFESDKEPVMTRLSGSSNPLPIFE